MSRKAPESTDGLFAPWGDHPTGEGEEEEIRLGPLDLRVRREDGEVWLSHVWSQDDPAVSPRIDVDQGEWSRWAIPEGAGRLRLQPVLPDRPLVVEPERAFHLVPGARVRIYVRVPLRIRIELVGKSPITLTEIPTINLSDTWFGEATEGELAYALPTTARREVTSDVFRPHLAVCPLALGNDSEDQLEVKKLCLRVAHLSLFARGSEIWSDETRVRYRGEDQGSDLRMTGRPPSEAPEATRIAEPRVPAIRGFRARTFARLAGLPGLGGLS